MHILNQPYAKDTLIPQKIHHGRIFSFKNYPPLMPPNHQLIGKLKNQALPNAYQSKQLPVPIDLSVPKI